MKMSQKSGTALAVTAAALLVSGTLAVTPAAAGAKGHCVGVNSCKGTSACKTATSSCKGHNACKGKGFLVMTKEECEKAGGKFEG
ncbi:MAG: hypothetical protein AAF405_00665 [Pseudomonadota bacterium]